MKESLLTWWWNGSVGGAELVKIDHENKIIEVYPGKSTPRGWASKDDTSIPFLTIRDYEKVFYRRTRGYL